MIAKKEMPKKAIKKPKVNQEKVKEFLMGKDAVKTEITTLVILLIFIMGYFAVRPFSASYKENRIDAENLKQEQSILQEKTAKLQNLNKQIEENSAFIDVVKRIVPVSREIPEIMVDLEKMAAANSLYVSNFKPKELTADEQKSKLSISGKKSGSATGVLLTTELQFDLVGTYNGFKGFIDDMESNIRPYDIRLLRVSGGGQISKGEMDPLKYSITVFTYSQPEPKI